MLICLCDWGSFAFYAYGEDGLQNILMNLRLNIDFDEFKTFCLKRKGHICQMQL